MRCNECEPHVFEGVTAITGLPEFALTRVTISGTQPLPAAATRALKEAALVLVPLKHLLTADHLVCLPG